MTWQEQMKAAISAAMDDGQTSRDVERFVKEEADAETERRRQATAAKVWGGGR